MSRSESVTLLAMPSTLLARLAEGPLLADGAMGTLLYERGIPFDQCFDQLNLTQPAQVEGGCDGFILETFQDLNEILAAMRAVRKVSLELPVIAQMTFGMDGKTSYGHTPTLAARALAQAGADVIGVNCGVGPQAT